MDWLTIARKLAADPTANSDGIAYPQGYGIERYRKNQDPPTNEASRRRRPRRLPRRLFFDSGPGHARLRRGVAEAAGP
ncbi:hypothetical protein [Streptomyces sp.]|uniref:hypothetical protein n=1 Tax=Streptomyces sp. TaxID=1931 RepID=UPI002D77BA22|nr:hypothetical protein [Streptomyces sp.]HET6355413.1 hypothetical protein [Streptomyces sp.]